MDNSFIDSLIDIYKSKSIRLKGVNNIRDFGGYTGVDGKKVVSGKILRSSYLAKLTDSDIEVLKKYDINYIIDLRMEENRLAKPDRVIDGVTYVNCDLYSLERNEYREKISSQFFRSTDQTERALLANEIAKYSDMAQPYIKNLTSVESIEHIKTVFEVMLKDDCTGLLFHCSEGKDRTGIISALLLSALGVSEEEIRLDYYASIVPYLYYSEEVTYDMEIVGTNEDALSKFRGLATVDENIAKRFMSYMRQYYSSAEEYVLKTGILTEEKIRLLRDKYLC